jgi:hypothetical protein
MRGSDSFPEGQSPGGQAGFAGNVMTENRNGFVVEAELRQVSGIASARPPRTWSCAIRRAPSASR